MKKTALCFLLTLTTLTYASNSRLFEDPYVTRLQEHVLTDFSNSLIRLEDGSHFKTPDSSAPILTKWRPGDRLRITPNAYYFSFYSYRIQNLTLGTSILANLQYGPSIGSRFSKQIEELDYRVGLLRLSDDSYWGISDEYLDQFYHWRESDYIIIGSSNKSYYKNILINVKLNQYVEACLYE